MSDTQSRLREIIALAKNGKQTAARTKIAQLIQEDQNNADAWIVMAQLVDDKGQEIDCWRQALRLRPGEERIKQRIVKLETELTTDAVDPFLSEFPTTAPASPNNLAKDKPKRKRSRVLTIIAAIVLTPCVLLGLLVGYFRINEALDPCSITKRFDSLDQLNDQFKEFSDETIVASTTPRISLPSVVSQLQAIRRATDNLEVPACMGRVKAALLVYMDTKTDVYLTFMNPDNSDAAVSARDKDADKAFDAYLKEIESLSSTPSPTAASSNP